jgi:hypothetical protein
MFTNSHFNKMVPKTSGPPLHSTRQASNKKTKSFQKLNRSYKQYKVKACSMSSGRAGCFLVTSNTTNLSKPHSLSRSFYGKIRIINRNTTLFWDCAALENLNDSKDINWASENIKENI